MKNQFIKDLRPAEKVSSEFVITSKTEKEKKNKEKYCFLTLQDSSGTIDAVIWSDEKIDFNFLNEGDFIRIEEGIVTEYRSKMQIEIKFLSKFKPGEDTDMADFERTTGKDISRMFSEMMDYISSIGNKFLKELLDMFFKDEKFAGIFCNATAAVQYHHAYKGGLLEHTLSVLKICDFLSGHYDLINRDLLLSGAIFHDIGKIREYSTGITTKISDEGKLLGHITIGYGIVLEKIRQIKGFPKELEERLLHIILSHHGQKEFGSPKRPKILEAFIVFHIDYLDADIGGFSIQLEESGKKNEWSDYLRNFERSIFLRKPDFETARDAGDAAENEDNKLF